MPSNTMTKTQHTTRNHYDDTQVTHHKQDNEIVPDYTHEQLISDKMQEICLNENLIEAYIERYIETKGGVVSFKGDEELFQRLKTDSIIPPDIEWSPEAIEIPIEDFKALAGPKVYDLISRKDTPPATRTIPWTRLSLMPGYNHSAAIRVMGRDIFGNLPSFQHMAQKCRAAGRDPVGEIRCLMADSAGHGGTVSQRDLQAVLNFVQANGKPLERQTLSIPGIIENYTPELMLAVTRTDAFLVVQDNISERGMSYSTMSVYTWEIPPNYIPPAEGDFAFIGKNTTPQNQPRASIGNDSVVHMMAALGFEQKATLEGPRLQKTLDDDSILIIEGADNLLSKATLYSVCHEHGGHPISEDVVPIDGLHEWIESCTNPSFKP